MSADSWGGRGWLNKLSWLFDASVDLVGFSGERTGHVYTLDWLIIFRYEQIHLSRLHSLLITDQSECVVYLHLTA